MPFLLELAPNGRKRLIALAAKNDAFSIIPVQLLSIPKVSVRQIKAARALLDWSQDELAAKSGVSIPTIKRLEARDGPLGGSQATAERIMRTLEAAGVDFIGENGGGPGVRLLRHG